ncbi:hypothetical protein JOB18_034629 [Solea senegalensis]|uniref:Uncharacterized protein n=1 Tax=Solea senegalensis TaxID=28829 RepID=A0AAV6R1V7_SOLSE|nr:hypothetical protein JOB18_034629 [Solea senegalensis]
MALEPHWELLSPFMFTPYTADFKCNHESPGLLHNTSDDSAVKLKWSRSLELKDVVGIVFKLWLPKERVHGWVEHYMLVDVPGSLAQGRPVDNYKPFNKHSLPAY